MRATQSQGAAEADDSGVFQTSPGLIKRAILGPWAEGISQYLALRIKDPKRAQLAFEDLRTMVSELPPEVLLKDPGPKAQIYRMARSLAESEWAMPGPPASGKALRWRDGEEEFGHALDRLRNDLSDADAELIELRHARELTVPEIAGVLELPIDEVELALDRAEALARRMLGEQAPDPVRICATVFVDAFALQRSWRDETVQSGESADEKTFELALGTVLGGRYRLVERVGTGAFGDVYLAQDIEVQSHRVALKILRRPALSEGARLSALRELRLNATVFHPSIVQFKDHGWYKKRLWFVMPWYVGETLEQRIRREPLGRAEARVIFEALAQALATMHRAGIRHQDVKPDNIFLAQLGSNDSDEVQILPVLIDLGVAAESEEGLLGGTPLYFAPEVAHRFLSKRRTGPEVNDKADVFALALSLRNALEPETQPEIAAGAVNRFVQKRAEQTPLLPQKRELRFLRPEFARWLHIDASERPDAETFGRELAALTAPEETRERRLRVARWLIPSLTIFVAIVATVFFMMDMRAQQHAMAAREAQDAAASAQADLVVARTRGRAMEEGHAALLSRYEESRLSRRDLSQRLVQLRAQVSTFETQLQTAAQEQRALETREQQLGNTLRNTRQTLTLTEQHLSETQTSLTQTGAERDRLRQAEREGQEALQGLRSEVAQRIARITELERDVTATQAARDEARRRVGRLQSELEEARAGQTAAQADLRRVRGHVARLAGLLQEANRTETSEANSESPVGEGSSEPSVE